MMDCIIIEDQPPAQRILKKYIADIEILHLKACFSNAIEAMAFLKTEQVGLIFLDIHLPKISGMDFLKMIPQQTHIILTTAFPDYALQSYEYSVVDYLLKPFSFQRFVKAIHKIPITSKPSSDTKTQNQIPEFRKELFIKSGHELYKIITDDIILIKSDADYTEIITTPKKYLATESLRHWEEKLNMNQFARIHKSFIINTAKIEKISGNQVYLTNHTKVPIGRSYKTDFIKRFVE
ncbi:LytR/AlgR family response regulator transcription factor [Saccharicrinis fermentans]|uniref:Sensory transduction protein LytR n=1 Tax=Saccharicrinis fermentans DSM 9555 = JCM 21142 TaxID=869213 RepID=W7YQE8_9BACT|nr:LytTR family DNA-binding domain-containing protein [Saccharicrinis fermentans]GAF04624.1 sensory transduction protein LytR [Saccharicrinis fermentans DSM 9555 = JCM 21142]